MSCFGNSADRSGFCARRKGAQNDRLVLNPYTKDVEILRPHKRQQNTISMQLELPRVEQMRNNEWVGKTFCDPPKNNATRLMVVNCNGLETGRDPDKFRSQITSILEHHVHYFGLTEINLNARNYAIKEKLMEILCELVPSGIFDINNTPVFRSRSRYQPGGVAAGFFGKLRNRYVGTELDSCGRFIAHKFHGKNARLKILTLYRVNPGRDEKMKVTAWKQQRLFFKRRGIEENPRRRVISDIIANVSKSISEGYEILILADLNESHLSKEGTNEKIEELGLVNILVNFVQNPPNTYRVGSMPIDHIYGTKAVVEHVKRVGYAPVGLIHLSDHRPLFCDLSLMQLLDEEDYEVRPFHLRKLRMGNPNRVEKYLKNIEAQWNEHNIDMKYKSILDFEKKNKRRKTNMDYSWSLCAIT